MSHFHIDVLLLLTSAGHRAKVTLCVPWEDLVVVDDILILREAKRRQGVLCQAFAKGEYENLVIVNHD